MKVELFQGFYTAPLIQLQIRPQGIGGNSTQLGDLVVRYALALEPQGFHPLLHTRMRMMVAFVMQRLLVCLTEYKLEHPGVILWVRRRMVMPHHRGCTDFAKAQTMTVVGIEGFLEELGEFQSNFHDCFPRSEPRAHCF